MQKEQRRAEMKALVEQWHTSGQSKRSFAESHKIGYHIFLYWFRKFEQEESLPDDHGFIELSGTPAAGIIIRYPNGIELNLPGNVPLSYLKSLTGQ